MILRAALAFVLLGLAAEAQTISQPYGSQEISTAAGGTAARTAASRAADHLNAQDFGSCTWDATHDVGPCIQAAITYAETLTRGATIFLPRGVFKSATQLAITKDNVSLVADGRGGLLRTTFFPSTTRYGTTLEWSGTTGTTMLTVSPPTNMVNGVGIGGANVRGILFDCKEIADTGVKFASVWDSWIDIAVNGPVGDGVIFTGAQINGSSTIQGNDVWLSVTNRNGTGAAVVFDARDTATGVGNVSLNKFHSIRIQHAAGDGLVSRNSDNNTIDYLWVFNLTGGVGRGVVLKGATDPAGIGTQGLVIGLYSANSSFVVEGTDTGGVAVPAKNNAIYQLDTLNASPEPTIGTGASIVYRRADNIWSEGLGFLGSVHSNTLSDLFIGRTDTGGLTDPVKIYTNNNSGLLWASRDGSTPYSARAYIDQTTNQWFLRTVTNLTGFSIGSSAAPLIANVRLKTSGTAPTVSACGTSPSVVTGNSISGTLTMGTGAPTACTLTFVSTSFSAAPKCIPTLNVGGAPVAVTPTAISTSAVTFTAASAATSGTLSYVCIE